MKNIKICITKTIKVHNSIFLSEHFYIINSADNHYNKISVNV